MSRFTVKFKTKGDCYAEYGRDSMEAVEETVRYLKAQKIESRAVDNETGEAVATAERVRGLWKVTIGTKTDKPAKTGWPFHGRPA